MPSSVSADTADRAVRLRDPTRARRSALFATTTRGARSSRRAALDRRRVSGCERSSDDDQQVRDRARLTRARDAFVLDRVAGALAQAGRVDQRERQAVDVDALGHQIARRARDVGDDRARRAGERVEQARLARVRPSDDRRPSALRGSAGRARASASSASIAPTHRVDRPRAAASGVDEVIALVRKIERRLEPRDQIEQRRVDLAAAASVSVPSS